MVSGGLSPVGKVLGTSIAVLLLAACSTADNPKSPTQVGGGVPVEQRSELRDLAEMLDITHPPEVEVIREISPGESQKVYEDCLQAAGWKQHPDGSFEYPAEQEAAFNLASYICTAQYPIAPRYLQPLTDEQYTLVYDHLVNEWIPCVESYGLTVAEPPTRERYLAAPTEAWSPQADVEQQVARLISQGTFTSFQDFYKACPAAPSNEELYGAG